MQSAAQYRKQALSCACSQLLGILQESENRIVFQLTNRPSEEIEPETISYWLNSIKSSAQIALYSTKHLEDHYMKSIHASKPLHEMFNEFYAKMEPMLKSRLIELKIMAAEGLLGCEAECSMLINDLQAKCNTLKASIEERIMNIMHEIKDVDDSQAVSTQGARALVETQESETMITQSQIRKRKAEHQSLGDESVSSKRRNDTQPVLAESAYEPDTMLSSATVSSYESAVRYQ